MSGFIDEMNAKYREEEKKKTLRQQEEKKLEQQELPRIKDLIFNEFVQEFKNTMIKNNYCYIEENGRKHFKGKMWLEDYKDGDSTWQVDASGYYMRMGVWSSKVKNTIFGKKYKFDTRFFSSPSCSVRLTFVNSLHIHDTVYGQYLYRFSFYSGDGKELCNKLKKEIPSIVFTKGSYSNNIIFDIYI